MTVSNWQALVIQKVDNAIHCINHYPADNAVGIHNTYPHWIVIYPVDCAIEHLINRGQNCNVDVADIRTTALVLFNSKLSLPSWKFSALINATVREKAKNKQTNQQTRRVAYEDVTGCRYSCVHELTVILPPRAMYD